MELAKLALDVGPFTNDLGDCFWQNDANGPFVEMLPVGNGVHRDRRFGVEDQPFPAAAAQRSSERLSTSAA